MKSSKPKRRIIEMERIVVGNISIDVEKKDIKNLHLGVYPPNGRVRIAAPLRVNEDAIRLFAVSKLGWIKKQQRFFEGQERETEREYISGESHYFNGKRYLLNIIPTSGKHTVVLKHKRIDLYVKKSSPVKNRAKVIATFYRAYLHEKIADLITKWEKRMKVKVSGYGIKKMKTKWGTCNIEAQRIWVNLELAKKPYPCLEYIIVHEMIHLLERHHNDIFIAYMDKFLPQWRALKSELNKSPVSHSDWEY
jgi:predicted metal-dependent hydrolase